MLLLPAVDILAIRYDDDDDLTFASKLTENCQFSAAHGAELN